MMTGMQSIATGLALAMNPGSVYGDRVLQGAVLELDAKKGKVSKYLLVNG